MTAAATKGLTDKLAEGLKLTDELTAAMPASTVVVGEESTTKASSGEDGEATSAPSISFLFEGDLLYELSEERSGIKGAHKCHYPACPLLENWEKGGPRFPTCAKCGTARYCGRDHQTADWKISGHKSCCAQFKALLDGQPLDKHDIVVKLLCKIRLHLGPFTIAHSDKQGKGFAFVQSSSTLEELSLNRPISRTGRQLTRMVILHFLTWGEFVSVVLEDDFEIVTVKQPLETALATYDPETHFVVLLKLRCGYVAVLKLPLALRVNACRSLALDYGWAEHSSLQLELD